MSDLNAYPNAEAMSHPINFKVTHASQQLARRLRFSTPPSYATLSAKLVSLWSASGLSASNMTLSYVDGDGDRVVLSSDEELQGYYDELRGAGTEKDVVKMRVVLARDDSSQGGGPADQAGMEVDIETGSSVDKEAAEAEQIQQLNAGTASPAEGVPAADTQATNPFADSHPTPSLIDQFMTGMSVTPVDEPSTPLRVPEANLPSTSEETPSNGLLVDDSEPAVPNAPVAADADPEEVFPSPADAVTTDALPTPTEAAPSLLADLSLLLTSITSSPALAQILARAAQGAYTPELTQKGAHVKVQMDHVREELAKGLGEAGKGVKQAEGVVNGLAKAVMEGLEQVNEVRRERERARAAAEAPAESAEAGAETAENERERVKAEEEAAEKARAEQSQREAREAEEARMVAERAAEIAAKKVKLEQLRQARQTRVHGVPTPAPVVNLQPRTIPGGPSPFGGPNLFAPPVGPPPSGGPFLFGQPHPRVHRGPPHHRHSFPVPGAFPDFVGGRPSAGTDDFETRYYRLSAQLADMGFKTTQYAGKLSDALKSPAGRRQMDQEVVTDVVRMIVSGEA